MANKAIMVQGGDGTAIPAGMVGESIGASTANTTNTTVKRTVSTTVAGINSVETTLLTQSFNKGVYLVTVMVSQQKSSSGNAAYLLVRVMDGVSKVYPNTATVPVMSNISNGYVMLSFSFPVTITSDSTSLAVRALWNLNEAAGVDVSNEMSAIRIG